METRTLVLPVPTRVLMSAVCMALAMSALFFLIPSQAHAADRFFIGSVNNSWNDTGNWSATLGGAGGQTVPGAADIAYFGLGSKNVTIQQAAAVVVDGIVLTQTFTGSVNVGTGILMVRETGIEVGSGRLIASGAGWINCSGSFVQTGGIVRIRQFALSGSFTAKLGADGASMNNSASGYVFTSTGVVTFNRLDGDQAIVIGASGASFSGITVNLRGGTTIDDVTVNASGALTLSGNLVITRGNLDFNVYNENLIVDEGDITLADTDSSGAANAQLTTDQNVTHSGGNLTVNYDAIFTMTGGTWTYQGGRTDDITYQLNGPDKRFFNFTLNDTAKGSNDSVILAGSGLNLSGALTITEGNLDLTTNSKAMIVERGVTVANSAEAQLTSNSAMTISGSLTVNASSVLTITAGTTTFIDDSDIEVDLNDQSLYHVTINVTSPSGISVGSGVVVKANRFSASGNLTVTNGRLDLGGRQMTITGSITIANDGDARLTGTGQIFLGGGITHGTAGGLMLTGATVTLNGGADQSVQILSVGSRFGALTINNRGGALADDIIWSGAPLTVSGALTITLGNLDVGSNDIVLRADGGVTLASNAQTTLTTDSNMAMSGTISVGASAVLVVTGGTLTLNDDGPQSVDLNDQIVNSVTLNVLTTGTENGAVHIEPGSSFISSGSLTITKGDLRAFGKTLTVSGSITIADDGQATLVATGTVNIGGNVTQNFAGGLMLTGATLTLNGRSDQTIVVKSPGPGRIGAFTVNNIGSSFGAATFDDVLWTGATLSVSGALTVTKGNFDFNVYNINLLADGGITLASDSEARLTTDQNISVSGSFVVGASAVMLLTGGTVTFNDDGNMEVDLDDQELQNVTLNLIPVVTGEDNLVVRDDTFTASGKLTVTRGELDMGGQALNISGSIIIANAATAAITATGDVTFGSGMDIGAAGTLFLTGANLTLNGIDQQLQFGRTITEDETVSINGGYLRNLTITAASGVTLTSGQVRAFNTLTISTGSVLALGANTLGNTGGTIFNYALLREDTGKVVNTGTLLNIADSNYADVAEVKTAQTAYFTFREDDENISGTAKDTLSVTITTAAGESETLTLTETTNTSRIFRGSLVTEKATVVKNDGKIQTTADTTLTVSFTDAEDALVNTDTVDFTIVGGAVAAGGGGGSRGGGGGGGGGGSTTSVSLVEKLVTAQQKAKEEEVRKERLEERIEEEDLGTRGVLEATVEGKKVAFKDVPVKQWFAQYVLRVIDSGIASGYKDARGRLTGTFGPANNVTYSEIAKMALEAAGKDVDDVAGKPKNRMARGDWSEKYIKLAEDLKLSVYGSDLKVNSPATRGSVVQTIMEAAGFDIGNDAGDYKDLRGSHPNANAIGSATELGIVSGDTDREGEPIGRFRPNDPINRAEVSKIMSKVLELLGR